MAVKAKAGSSKTRSVPSGGYEALVKEAILALDERKGSSPYAIVKYLDTTYKAIGEEKLKLQVKHSLKRMQDKGVVARVKNSYKLTPKGKVSPTKKPVGGRTTAAGGVKKATVKKVVKKTATAKKASVSKKVTAKKAASAKGKRATGSAAASAKPKKTITKKRKAPASGTRTSKRTRSKA